MKLLRELIPASEVATQVASLSGHVMSSTQESLIVLGMNVLITSKVAFNHIILNDAKSFKLVKFSKITNWVKSRKTNSTTVKYCSMAVGVKKRVKSHFVREVLSCSDFIDFGH